MPYRSIAWTAYREHVGSYRQRRGRPGEIARW
jgi:hypothetical protein